MPFSETTLPLKRKSQDENFISLYLKVAACGFNKNVLERRVTFISVLTNVVPSPSP